MSRASPSSEPRAEPGRRRRVAALALSLALLVLGGAAGAQSARLLDAPRAAGIVGERYDGYAVAHGAVPPDVAALIDRVNAERRAIYAQHAQSEKVPIEAIGKIYAGQIVTSAPAGTWFLAEDGRWKQK
jgi:uncharacterized protein YdbL (DUF1318 family)